MMIPNVIKSAKFALQIEAFQTFRAFKGITSGEIEDAGIALKYFKGHLEV